ncbi:MAG: hypothetical protein A4E70_02155 [Syntrophus sp. PtaU1.Bin005]|nr:MAG: hypothetical protein A4E70_02155 [Syntrophus sp. PtaU1.Bin005]
MNLAGTFFHKNVWQRKVRDTSTNLNRPLHHQFDSYLLRLRFKMAAHL